MSMPDLKLPAYEFWEEIYQNASSDTQGEPSAVLKHYVENLPLGRALDLGCARGDDAVWLARLGWRVTAVDISPTVLRIAQENAKKNGVADLIDIQCHDLSESFPVGTFNLVSAMYLQTPLKFPRSEVLNRAANALSTGGLLLVVNHGSVAPWSWGDPKQVFPTARDCFNELCLSSSEWKEVFVNSTKREAIGTGGETAMVIDTIVAVERR